MFNQFKYILTKIGPYCSASVIHGLNASVNYLEVGRWFKDNELEIPRRFKDRYHLFDSVAPLVENKKVLYLEFGVWKGEATQYWSRLLKNPASRLFGFDSFEGLPENWNLTAQKSYFSTDGKTPLIDDSRLKFIKGWFSETLPSFVIPQHDQLIINIDSDLYSSAKTVLQHFVEFIKPGTLIYFDEFSDREHELKAFDEFIRETGMKFRVLGTNELLSNVIFERV